VAYNQVAVGDTQASINADIAWSSALTPVKDAAHLLEVMLAAPSLVADRSQKHAARMAKTPAAILMQTDAERASSRTSSMSIAKL